MKHSVAAVKDERGKGVGMGEVIDLAVIGSRMLVESLEVWAEGTGDVRIVHTGNRVDDLLGNAADGQPQIVLLDWCLQGRADSLNSVRLLARADRRVLLVSGEDDMQCATASIAAGAYGYLTTDHGLAMLERVVRAAAAADRPVSGHPFVVAGNGRPAAARPRLSPRELAVFVAYASGLTLQSAARRVGVSPATARTYLERVKVKYQQLGRPAQTKLQLAMRLSEDFPDEAGRS